MTHASMHADGGMTVIKSGIAGIIKAYLHAIGRVSELFAYGRKDAEVGNRCQLLTRCSRVSYRSLITGHWTLGIHVQ